jgi:hypothetical protein
MQKRQVLNSILAAIANLRNLIQLMSETEASAKASSSSAAPMAAAQEPA